MQEPPAASDPSESATSKIFPQIHPAVEAGHLRGVAIEGKGGLPRAECTRADVPFAGLAPSRMVDGRIDVGKKTILIRRRARPGGARRALRQFDADDGLDALEAVIPGNDQPQRPSVP